MIAGAPMSAIKTSLQAKGYGADTATAQTELINSCYRRILSMRRWTFLEKLATFPTVVGQEAVTLNTADMVLLKSVRAATPAGSIGVTWKPVEELRDLLKYDPSNGEPEFWSKANDQLVMYPRPDRVYTLEVLYTYLPPDLVADSDVLVIPRGFEDTVVWNAVMQMAYRQRDWSAFNAAKGEFNEGIKEMVDAYAKEQNQTSREIRRWDGWSDLDR